MSKEELLNKLQKEYDELESKLVALNDFMDTADEEEVYGGEDMLYLMDLQYSAMSQYLHFLMERIELLKSDDDEEEEEEELKKTDSLKPSEEVLEVLREAAREWVKDDPLDFFTSITFTKF